MSYGSSQEFMVFPIIELIRRELKNQINSGSLNKYGIKGNNSKGGAGSNLLIEGDTNVTINYGNIMSRLESNDYDLVLEKKDPQYPNRLTSAIFNFGNDLTQIINLIRNNNRLEYVKISVVIKEESSNVFINPYNMSRSHFIEYMTNKNVYAFYTAIKDNTIESTNFPAGKLDELKLVADSKIELASFRNGEIRNLYGISQNQDLAYSELKQYLPNPLAMNEYDYIDYVFQKWIWVSTHPSITQQIKDDAHSRAYALREQYGIISTSEFTLASNEVDLPYKTTVGGDDLFSHLPNPLCMHSYEFKEYVELRKEYDSLDPSNEDDAARIIVIQQQLQDIRDQMYIVSDAYTTADLETFLVETEIIYDEKLLFKILISLKYDSNGKLIGVKSETQD